MKQKNNGSLVTYILLFVVIILLLASISLQVISILSNIGEIPGIGESPSNGNVAVIQVKGDLVSDSFDGYGAETASSEIAALIEKAAKDESIRAIVLEINSNGGSGYAALEIGESMKSANKTTVAWIREFGNSAGYFSASYADYIIADKLSYVGSIGVIIEYEVYNVTYETLKAGRYKDIFTSYRTLTDEERKIAQEDIDFEHDVFVDEVARNRRMKKSEVQKVANGLSYNGVKAKELGLIDEVGGKSEVIKYIKEKEGIEPVFVYYNSESGIFESEEPSIPSQDY